MDNSSFDNGSALSKIFGKCKSVYQTKVISDKNTICYYLLKGYVHESGRDTFGILITESDGEDITDCEFVSDISAVQSGACRIYDILCRNTVSPCSLFDVLDDLL